MELFAEKLRKARAVAGLYQAQLGERIGVSVKSINAYENSRATPRKSTIRKLAKELNVTVEYLTNDSVTDPIAEQENERRIDTVRDAYGERGAQDVCELLQRNTAFLAGGDVDQEAKDAFFDAIMAAYLACKREASAGFTPHGKREHSTKE